MSDPKKQMEQLRALFRTEAKEHLETLNQVLLQLETQQLPTEKGVNDLFRAAHSLKGAARTVEARQIEQVAHAMESTFDAVRSAQIDLGSDVADVLYDALDFIQLRLDENDIPPELSVDQVLSRLQTLLGTSSTSAMVPASPQEDPDPIEVPVTEPSSKTILNEEVIRVPVSRLNTLLTDVSNLLVSRMNIEQRAANLVKLRQDYHRWQQLWRRFHVHYIRLVRDNSAQAGEQAEYWQPLLHFLQETQEYMRTAGKLLVETERQLNEDALMLGLSLDTLQHNVRNVRLLPFETILNSLQRTVRDVARDLGKKVRFQPAGTRLELDKQVLERLKDPLIQLLRNAVDHGIESPEQRLQLGKNEEGTIILGLVQRGNKVHIVVSDDGRGVDVNQVQNKAKALGILGDEEASAVLDAPETYELLMRPGMTTRDSANEISGRGIGLDIVREEINALQGQIQISSDLGKGTTFELIVPISLSTMHCMLVAIGDEWYAIPTTTVLRVVDLQVAETFSAGGRPMLSLGDRAVLQYDLAQALGRPPLQRESSQGLALVLQSTDRTQAFVVDDVIAEQEVIVRSLSPELEGLPNISGATLLADGRVVLILNVSDLMKSSRNYASQGTARPVPSTTTTPQPYCILVVDDSITTRTLQKNILEAAGYVIITATHGLEALEILNTQHVDLVISDVEMPWLNGFELTEKVRQQVEYQDIPIILVTSLDSEVHRRRGIQAGADAYIPKGVFDQNELLATIKQLL